MKKLFYGDKLQILREHIADESVDLIYLDPPFNSGRDCDQPFMTPNCFASLSHEPDMRDFTAIAVSGKSQMSRAAGSNR
jgi:16S rRNA G966 N2-methylase RsmD